MLGRLLVPTILDAVQHDVENTVFSYIPNTAEVAFIGMTEEIQKQHIQRKLKAFNAGEIKTTEELHEQLSVMPRVEKIAIKDVKMRTFITDDSSRNDLVSAALRANSASLLPASSSSNRIRPPLRNVSTNGVT